MGSEWTTCSLKEAGVQLIDCDHKTPKAQEAGFPYIGIPQMRNGNIDFDANPRLISESDLITWTKKAKPQTSDVILSRRCNPGETAHVTTRTEFALDQNLVLLRAEGEKVFPPYLRWVARSHQCWAEVGKYLNQGAVFDSLKCADIPKFEVPFPPLPEQKAIAHILGSLDDKIELNRKMNATLEAMAQALFKSWFVDFDPVIDNALAAGNPIPEELAPLAEIRRKVQQEQPELFNLHSSNFPSSFTYTDELGYIPEGWEVGIISELLELHRGFDLSAKERVEGSIPVYSAGGIHGQHNVQRVEAPGIITGRSGVIGNVFLSLTPFWPLNTTLYVREFRRCDPYYALHFLKSLDLKVYNSGSAVPSLNRNYVHSTPTALPSKQVLDGFEIQWEAIFSKIKANEEKSSTLGKLRDTLLPKLISGELRIQGSEQPTEEALA